MKTIELFSKWDDILKKVEDLDKTLAFCLKRGFLSDIEGRELIIEFDDIDKFHKKIVEKRKNTIKKAIQNVMGSRYSVRLLVVENAEDRGLPF